jgi:D-lactate dehydrogenase
MRVAAFSTKPYDERFLRRAAEGTELEWVFLAPRLTEQTWTLAHGFPAICVFVNDQLDAATIAHLAQRGLRVIALRCAGFNNVDLIEAARRGVRVVRVPAYSPEAVAEHTLGLILCLNRKLHIAYNRVRDGNFSLDRLLGFDIRHRTVGVVGTGRIGQCFARLLRGFGCRVLLHDPYPHPDASSLGEYVAWEQLLTESDIISLHCPLTPDTHHLIRRETLQRAKRGMMLVNTSRGALIDTQAVVDALKSGQLGALAIDVYEEEADLFFEDLSGQVIQDDVFSRLLTFPNVLITGHQAFFTQEALEEISRVTVGNLLDFHHGRSLENEVTAERHMR